MSEILKKIMISSYLNHVAINSHPPRQAQDPPRSALLFHHAFRRGLRCQQGAHGDPQAALGAEGADAQRLQRAETQGGQQRGRRHGATEDLQQNLGRWEIPKGMGKLVNVGKCFNSLMLSC